MREVTLFDAKTHLSALIAQVSDKNEEILITRRGQKVAKIVPVETERRQAIEDVISQMEQLSKEIGKRGVKLSDIKAMKEEGRK